MRAEREDGERERVWSVEADWQSVRQAGRPHTVP